MSTVSIFKKLEVLKRSDFRQLELGKLMIFTSLFVEQTFVIFLSVSKDLLPNSLEDSIKESISLHLFKTKSKKKMI